MRATAFRRIWLRIADGAITIPCPGPVESLNAAVAAERAALRGVAAALGEAADRRIIEEDCDEPVRRRARRSATPRPKGCSTQRRRWRSGCGRARWKNTVGQEHLLGPGKPLRVQIERDGPESTKTGSMIFWGPPGVGKTTLAKIIAETTQANFVEFSAVMSGIKEIKQVMASAAQAARDAFADDSVCR